MNDPVPSDPEVSDMTRLLRRGDEGAWRWLHHHYFGILRAAAIARGAPAGEAADLVQRTYLRVLRHARRFTSETGFRAWLCCLLRCEAIDAARQAGRRLTLMEKFRHWQELRTPRPDQSSALLDSLPAADRRLMTLHYLHGWTQQELAARNGTSAKAVESKLARLRKRLRQTLTTRSP